MGTTWKQISLSDHTHSGYASTSGATFSGLVRIGTSPATHSTISTNAVFGVSTTGVAHPLAIANTASATTGDEARLSFVHDTGWSVTGYIGSKVENSSTAKTGLVFGTYDGSLSQKMVLTGSGNVGIGVTDPDMDVEIKKSSANVTLKINAATAANDSQLQFCTGDSADWLIGVDGSATNDPLKFYDYASSSNVLVLNNGNVGIG